MHLAEVPYRNLSSLHSYYYPDKTACMYVNSWERPDRRRPPSEVGVRLLSPANEWGAQKFLLKGELTGMYAGLDTEEVWAP